MLVSFMACVSAMAVLAGAQARRADAGDSGTPAHTDAHGSEATPAPAPASRANEFKLGIGDVIHVSVWREPELTETAVIRPDGSISLPLAGEISVAGITTLEAEGLIRSLLLKYVTDPKVSISVTEIHSRQVYITGQVQRPGAYPLLGSCNVLQLIASAGGLTPFAHKKHIIILDASNRPLTEFDYENAIKGDPRQGRTLQPGDTVVVP